MSTDSTILPLPAKTNAEWVSDWLSSPPKRPTFGILLCARRADEPFLKLASFDLVHRVEQIRDPCRVPRKLGQFLVAIHDTAERIARTDQQTSVGDEAYRTVASAISCARPYKH